MSLLPAPMMSRIGMIVAVQIMAMKVENFIRPSQTMECPCLGPRTLHFARFGRATRKRFGRRHSIHPLPPSQVVVSEILTARKLRHDSPSIVKLGSRADFSCELHEKPWRIEGVMATSKHLVA